MATVNFPLDDETILKYLREERGFDEGEGKVTAIDTRASMVPSNDHPTLEVAVRFKMTLDEFKMLIDG